MTRTLLTGGSGFIAAHVLDHLLERGHSVVTTVRSPEKFDKIKQAYPNVPASRLSFTIVKDIAQHNAFDDAIISDPPFEAVIHTASPAQYNVEDIQKDLLDPAIIGTTGILKAIKKNAPSVKRVVITSSFAAIDHREKGPWPEHTYNEEDWSPITQEQALANPSLAYDGSKKLAEKAAWEFVAAEKPNFTLSTMNPPLVIGPIMNYLNSLSAINTSNQRTRDCMQGAWRTAIPDTGAYIKVDVRDLALGHVKAMEVPEAGGKRFFMTSGYFCNHQIADVVRENFPELADKAPSKEVKGGEMRKDVYKYDNSRAEKVLGMQWTPFEKSIVDLVKSLQAVGA